MHIEDMTPDHLRRLDVQQSQQGDPRILDPDNDLWFQSITWAACEEDGTPFACAGLIPLDSDGRYRAWTILCEGIGTRRLLWFARKLRNFQRHGDYRRLEAISLADAEDELYWIRFVLGFQVEGKMRAWTPDGSDVYLFSRIKGDEPEDTWAPPHS